MADISSDFRQIVNHDVIPLFSELDVRLKNIVERNAFCGPKTHTILGITVGKHANA